MTTLLRRLAYNSRRSILGVRQVHSNPYATHLPVLIGISALVRPKRVLELGSGPFSTPLFLDRTVFADVELLSSYEDDPDWAAKMRMQVGADGRCEFKVVSAVRSSVPKRLDTYDLIFIDDSRKPQERIETIQAVLRAEPTGIVVIHDFEQRGYRAAARNFNYKFIFRELTPQVGICWNGSDGLTKQDLRAVASRILANLHLEPTDIAAWRDVHLDV